MNLKGKLNGISLFTGYAGIDLALAEYVRPIVYCEIEPYPQGIILSRMDDGSIPFAPIWNDVTTLNGNDFKGLVDIVYGGFPCQDISVAGKGAGLEGKRSGLFFEIIRLCKEASPKFIFLENVPAIRTRGAIEVQEALASIGYDTRWTTLSAAEVGANHKRERWFCLAHSVFNGSHGTKERQGTSKELNNCTPGENNVTFPEGRQETLRGSISESNGHPVSDTNSSRLQEKRTELCSTRLVEHGALHSSWWSTEPDVGRVANGIAFRVDRIKALGNGVVPLQVKTAFEILMGIKG